METACCFSAKYHQQHLYHRRVRYEVETHSSRVAYIAAGSVVIEMRNIYKIISSVKVKRMITTKSFEFSLTLD